MYYRFEACSIEGFVQLLAANYVSRGYAFYVTGLVPEGKDPRRVDAKLTAKYDVNISPWARMRRRKAGRASIQYLRHGRFFVLLATEGEHAFFKEERSRRKFRDEPLRYGGYSISHRYSPTTKRWHAHVRIDRERYLDLRAYLTEKARHDAVETLVAEFQHIPFAPFAPVRRQLLNLLRNVNRVRRQAALEPVPLLALRLRRKPVVVYARPSTT